MKASAICLSLILGLTASIQAHAAKKCSKEKLQMVAEMYLNKAGRDDFQVNSMTILKVAPEFKNDLVIYKAQMKLTEGGSQSCAIAVDSACVVDSVQCTSESY